MLESQSWKNEIVTKMWRLNSICQLLTITITSPILVIFFSSPVKLKKKLKLKFRSKFNYGYLQSVVWKALDDFNPIDNGPFFTRPLMDWEAIKAPLAKTCFTYPTMMTLGTVISYPKKIQKIQKSRDAALEFCWHQHFFTENQQILLYQKNTDTDWIWKNNF